MESISLYDHQKQTIKFLKKTPRALITSDPGTGKTRSVLETYRDSRPTGRMLVLAPKSIMEPAWGADIKKFTPDLTYEISNSKYREMAFTGNAEIVITNHDAVKWINANVKHLNGFDWLVIDEFTAYKHRTSQRSKAVASIRKHFEHRIALSGTPNSNTILDLWHPTLIVDDGERLGNRFYNFRQQVAEPKQVGPHHKMQKWIDRDDAEERVAAALNDIVIRHKFEDCVSIPVNTKRIIYTDLAPAHMNLYNDLKDQAILELGDNNVLEALHAGVLVKKLLQVASGCVYDNQHNVQKLNTDRHNLVIELIEQRKHSIVAFNWAHERDELCKLAKKKSIAYAVIDGSVPNIKRTSIVNEYQAGKYQVLFAHPQSAAHGLTLTRGTTTIWASPTYNAEHFQQFNKRIYRAGQTNKTETILIAATNTWEEQVYKVLDGKLDKMKTLLDLLKELS